jgi:hypothetical protein
MTLSTVLSSIQSLLEKNPIVNEPGWEKYTLNDKRAKDYADLIQFRLIVISFRNLQRWKKGDMPNDWKEFEDVLEERGEELTDTQRSLLTLLYKSNLSATQAAVQEKISKQDI